MAKIEDLLHRRTDLSTFLVHLTRDGDGSARDKLISTLEAGLVEARTPLGPARHLEEHLIGTIASQKVVCLTETPLEHVWMMLENIEKRQMQFRPYGLATTKAAARHAGANPVWYSDMTKLGRNWPLKHMGDLVARAVEHATVDGVLDADVLADDPILQLTPYFETMGPTGTPGEHKEFWWEREWRIIGDYYLGHPRRWVAVLAPEHDHEALRAELEERDIDAVWVKRPILNPSWGLERMIAHLAQVKEDYIGPFTER